MRRLALLISISLFCLTSCKTTPPVTAQTNLCDFKPRRLIINDPDFEDRRARPKSLPPSRRISIPSTTLVLSGGNQNGAFGSGFLKRWAELSPGGKLPEFGLVTGISTGAILATWAFIREPEVPYQYYRPEDEKQILNAYVRPSRDGSLGLGAYVTLLRKNAFADLDPLRAKLRELLTFETLTKVTKQSGELIVGAVEVDTGELQQLDLKAMAVRAVAKGRDAPEFVRYRDCYLDAILASSSAPLAAKPVFIDNRMYIDGGARFGVFVDYLREDAEDRYTPFQAIRPGSTPGGDEKPDGPRLYILVNGTLWITPRCGRLGEVGCDKDDFLYPDPVGNDRFPAKKWDIADLALRSESILANQVYRFSVARVQAQYQLRFPEDRYNQRYYFARIHRTDINSRDRAGHNGKSCVEWLKDNAANLRPLQFHRDYMACLQEYGKKEAERLRWFDEQRPAQFEEMS